MTSRVIIPTDGSTRLFTVPFPFLHRDHVRFAVNRALRFRNAHFEWVGENQVEFFEAPPQGVLEIIRQTPGENALVDFQNGSVLTETELNLAVLQNLYLVQELKDYYEALINGSLDKLVLASGRDEAGPVIDKVIAEVLNSELLAELRRRITDIDTNANTINEQRIELEEARTRIDEWIAENGDNVATVIEEVRNEVVEGDTALAEVIGMIGAVSGDSNAFILDTDRVRVTPEESLGSRLSLLQSRIGDVTALVAEESRTRVTEDDALAERLTNVESSFGESNALVTQTLQTLAQEDQALANRIDGVLVQVGNDVTALLLQERTAWAAADQALSRVIDTVQNRVGEHAAAIQTQAQVLDGLKAQYTVKIDNNGVLSGFGLASGPTGPGGAVFSEFLINADRFAFVTPGRAPTVPFAADAHGVYMNDAFIRHLTVDKISGGAINDLWWMHAGGGRIVLDTGTHMKVIGVGFGAHSDLIEWFGPKTAINQCTRANGITWVGTDGQAYFGGNLRAGTIYNAQRTTNTQANAEVVCGPFGTLGRPKVVVVGYTFTSQQTAMALGNGGFNYGAGVTGATIELFRKIGAGGWASVASRRFDGSLNIRNEFDGPDYATHRISGSFTFTDNSAGTEERTFLARIVARDQQQALVSGTNVNRIDTTQELSIVSTEE